MANLRTSSRTDSVCHVAEPSRWPSGRAAHVAHGISGADSARCRYTCCIAALPAAAGCSTAPCVQQKLVGRRAELGLGGLRPAQRPRQRPSSPRRSHAEVRDLAWRGETARCCVSSSHAARVTAAARAARSRRPRRDTPHRCASEHAARPLDLLGRAVKYTRRHRRRSPACRRLARRRPRRLEPRPHGRRLLARPPPLRRRRRRRATTQSCGT